MKILFVLSQVQITGAETYALTLARALQGLGHSVVFVSDELHEPHSFKFHPLPIHGKNRSYWGRLQNVSGLRAILKAEKIELIHSHSRAANLITHLAARALPAGRTPYVTAVHGRWRNTFAFRHFPCLGACALAVCPYLERYLSQEIGFPSERIAMIPNSVDTQRFSPGSPAQASRPTLLYVGRFTGQKGNALRFLLKKVMGDVLNLVPDIILKILADAPFKEDLELVDGLNGGMGALKAVEILSGNVPSLPDLYRSSAAVVGAGRVALEALACGVPVVAIGESSAPGLLSAENWEAAFDSNFGDCGEWNLFKTEATRLTEDLRRILQDAALRLKLSSWGRDLILSRFDSRVVAPRVLGIYEKARRENG